MKISTGFLGRDWTDGSQDEHEGDPYHPQSSRKKRLAGLARPRKPSTSSDTEDDSSFYQMLDSEKISARKAEQLILERENALAGSSQARTHQSFASVSHPLFGNRVSSEAQFWPQS